MVLKCVLVAAAGADYALMYIQKKTLGAKSNKEKRTAKISM